MDIAEDMASHIVNYIAEQAEHKKVSPCKVLALVMKRCLLSDSCDCSHVGWMELKGLLDQILVEAQ